MSVSSGCVLLLALFGSESTSALPESAQRLMLRQAFHVRSVSSTWYTDLNAAKAEAVKSGLPLVLHFEAKWCGACRTMSRRVLSQRSVKDRLGRHVIGVKIDADRYPQLIRQFHVAVLPTDVYLDVDGRILAQESGYRSTSKYLASLDQASQANAGVSDWLNNPNIKLGRKALASESTSSNCVISRRAGVIIGLGGYSPVSMTRTMGWVRGNRNYASVYEGVMYYMKDAEELNAFEEAPAKFAPKLHGCDPVVLNNYGTTLPGVMTLGAFVDGNLYFFATEASRKLFKKNPSQFIKKRQLVRGEQLQTPGYQ